MGLDGDGTDSIVVLDLVIECNGVLTLSELLFAFIVQCGTMMYNVVPRSAINNSAYKAKITFHTKNYLSCIQTPYRYK